MKTHTTSSQAGQIAPSRPQTQVVAFLVELDDKLAHLEKALAIHAERIEPVMRPQVPQVDGSKAVPDESVCPIADRLRGQTRRLAYLVGHLEQLTDRTEA